jgi:isopenicillin N synthase-like dioxygenase
MKLRRLCSTSQTCASERIFYKGMNMKSLLLLSLLSVAALADFTPSLFTSEQSSSIEVTQALHRDGMVVFYGDEDFSRSANLLFAEFAAFLKHSPEHKQQYSWPNPNTPSGYTKEVKFGAISGEKYFLLDTLIKAGIQPYPKDSSGNVVIVNPYLSLDAEFRKLCSSLQKSLFTQLGATQFEQAEIDRAFDSSDVLGKLHQYQAMTRSELEKMKAEGNLIVSHDGAVVSFPAHKDSGLYTFLIYRNNNLDGLQVKINGEFHNVHLPSLGDGVGIVVMAGRLLEEVSQGQQKALEHRVVSASKSDPNRMLLSYFVQWNQSMRLNINGMSYDAGEILGRAYSENADIMKNVQNESAAPNVDKVFDNLK